MLPFPFAFCPLILFRTISWSDGYKSSLTSCLAFWASSEYRYRRRNWTVSRWTWSSCSLGNDAIWVDATWCLQGTEYGTCNCSRIAWNMSWLENVISWRRRWRSSTIIKSLPVSKRGLQSRKMRHGKNDFRQVGSRYHVWGMKAISMQIINKESHTLGSKQQRRRPRRD